MSDYVPTSVLVLREQGPMTLRGVTTQTARKMGCNQMYDDVWAVLKVAENKGQARCISTALDDYRDHVWEATP